MSVRNMRRSVKAALVAAVAFTGLSVVAAQPAAAAGEGTTGRDCSWFCGKLTNNTSRGLWATLEWGTSDAERWGAREWVPAGTSMGGNASRIDVDGVLIPGGCTAYGVVLGGAYQYPVAWGGGWHKISGNEAAVLAGISC
ncbi:hypothetical protein [Streptomyces sp. NPDC097981]|uniref:hypothetical protein n=1 Tax=Streptomyces sp. NPDC097981 TaxID=3155428 RepID=UPI003317A6F9